MAKTDMIRARIEPELKAEAEAILSKLGLSATDAITVFYKLITIERGLPFEVKIPNKKTQKAMRAPHDDKNYTAWASLDELMKSYE